MVTTPGVWILRTRAQDPYSCCCRPGVGLRPAADHPQMVTTPGVLDPAEFGIAEGWKATASNAEVWVETVTEGGRRFMAAWRK